MRPAQCHWSMGAEENSNVSDAMCTEECPLAPCARTWTYYDSGSWVKAEEQGLLPNMPSKQNDAPAQLYLNTCYQAAFFGQEGGGCSWPMDDPLGR